MKTSEELKNVTNRIAKLETDHASIVKIIPDHQKQQADAEQDIAKYRADASNGNEAALKKYNGAKITADLHRDRVRDLKAEADGLQNQLAEAHATHNRLLVKQQQEILIGDTGKLRAIATELSDAIAAPAAQCADLKKQLKQLFVSALPLLGDREAFKALEKSINQSVDQAVRSQLQKSFSAVGIDLFDSKRYENSDFISVLEKPINDLMAALETTVYSNSNEHVEGRVRFRVRTQISGLFGMHLQPGQIASLNPDDPAVLRLVAAGGLEKAVGA